MDCVTQWANWAQVHGSKRPEGCWKCSSKRHKVMQSDHCELQNANRKTHNRKPAEKDAVLPETERLNKELTFLIMASDFWRLKLRAGERKNVRNRLVIVNEWEKQRRHMKIQHLCLFLVQWGNCPSLTVSFHWSLISISANLNYGRLHRRVNRPSVLDDLLPAPETLCSDSKCHERLLCNHKLTMDKKKRTHFTSVCMKNDLNSQWFTHTSSESETPYTWI